MVTLMASTLKYSMRFKIIRVVSPFKIQVLSKVNISIIIAYFIIVI